MKNIAVTAIDEKYFPGLVALRNSIAANSPKTELHCICHGNADLARAIYDLGVQPVHPPYMDCKLPTSSEWPNKIPAMYSRLWIPHMTEFSPARRTLWLDADVIVLRDLTPLFYMDMEGFTVASTVSDDPRGKPRMVHSMVNGLEHEKGNFKGLTSGVILFDHDAYKDQRILKQCQIIMNESELNLKFVVQSVLNLALRGEFLELDPMWQVQGNRKGMYLKVDMGAWIVHYVGVTPWGVLEVPHQIDNAKLWRKYYDWKEDP
jgi:lipopolysaccharide biosynthesis glycosyltransferase